MEGNNNMKQVFRSSWLKTAFLGALIAASTSLGFGQSGITNNPNAFDDSTSTTSFVTWWTGGGIPNPTMTWDSTLDAGNNPASGSVRYEVLFTGAASEQFASWFSIANRWGWDWGTRLDCSTYTNLAFDIKVDPASAITSGGNYGYLEVALVETADGNTWNRISEKGINIPLTATNWTHVNMPIDQTAPDLDKIAGFSFRMWSNGAHTNSLIFNLDNVAAQKPEGNVVIPPPTLSLEKPLPGLAFIAASSGQWDRQNIRTIGSNFNWIGRSGPVTYSFDLIKHAPVDGFQLHTYLVPGISNPTRPDSDWHETNCLTISINGNPSGGCWSTVNCKVNAPEDNGRQYEDAATGGGYLGGFWANNGVGTWTVTFEQDANIVINAPSGESMTNTIPSAILDVWKTIPYMQYALGIMPGDPARVGYKATVGSVKITGAADPLDVNFVGVPLDTTNTWTVSAASATYGVQQIPLDAAAWVNWTLPANGFELQTKATLAPGTWTSSTNTGYSAASSHHVLLRQSDMPGVNSGYFRLLKRTATKLQILLPGETSAPGTPTGKTGTPTQPQWGIEYTITVNAVDDTWNIVRSVSDTVEISSSDAFAAIVVAGTDVSLPSNITLANGSATCGIKLNAAPPATATITATDMTDGAKAPSTVTVSYTQ